MKRLAWLSLLAISCAAPRAQVSPVSMGPSKIRGTYVSATTGPATSGLTDAQLRATPVPVSGTVSIAANQSVNLAQVAGVATATGNGTNTGAVRVAIASDNTAFSVNATPVGTTTVTGTVTANAGTGTLAVSAASLPLPTGAATSANQTTLGSHTTKVNDGTNTAAVKPASTAAAATDPALVVAVSPNNTIPISAASLPLPTGAATSSNQTTLGSHTTKVNDGTNTAAVKAASTAAAATDPALVVAVSPNNTVPVNVSQVGAASVSTAASGVQKVGVVGNAGAIFDAATAAAVPANGIYQGLRAATANPTNATGGNLVGQMGDKAGRTVTTPVNVRELVFAQQTNVAVNTETTVVTAGAASTFRDLVGIIITTAGAAAQTITIKSGTAGTTKFVLNYPNAAVAPGAPLVLMFPVPVPQVAAATTWTVTQSLATACNYTFIFVENL